MHSSATRAAVASSPRSTTARNWVSSCVPTTVASARSLSSRRPRCPPRGGRGRCGADSPVRPSSSEASGGPLDTRMRIRVVV